MRKKIAFYYEKYIDMWNLGCILPNLANICLDKSTDAKFHPFTDGDRDLLTIFREHFVDVPSIIITWKGIDDETFFFETQQKCANLLFGAMLANYIPLLDVSTRADRVF